MLKETPSLRSELFALVGKSSCAILDQPTCSESYGLYFRYQRIKQVSRLCLVIRVGPIHRLSLRVLIKYEVKF